MKLAAPIGSGLGAAVIATFYLWKTTPWRLTSADPVFGVVVVGVFVVSPCAAFLLAAVLSRTKVGAGVVLALSLVATILGAVVCADAFFRHESPVYVLLFASIPVVQWGMGVAAMVAAFVLRVRQAAMPR